MPNTAVYNVYSPASGTEYVAPSAYWVIPNAGTQVKCTVQAFDSSGNLVQVANLFAYDYDETTATNKASFSGNFNTVDTITSNPNGTDVYAPGGKVTASGVYRIAMYLTYTGSAYDQPPNAPTNCTPTGGATVSTLTPTLAASFSDPTTGDTLYQYRVQVYNGSNGSGALQWDSGVVNASTTEISNAQSSKVYAGSALAFASSYSWRVQHTNQNGNTGPYSGWNNFSTVQGPNAPSSVLPSGQQTTLTPAFSYLYTNTNTGANQASYRYTITAQNGGALVYDSGTIAHNIASGVTQSGTIPSGAGLQNGTAYNFNVYATDTNSAQSPTTTSAFSIAPLPQVAPVSPIGNATVNTQTPTLIWSYTDSNYTQATYQVQVYNASTGALLWDSGTVSSAAQQATVPGGSAIAYNTSIKWHVQVTDTAGLASGYSSYAFALVENTPSATITSPTNGSNITNNSPAVTWTYTASSGGQPQASAQVKLFDVNNNLLQTYSLSGTGTSLTIPSGVLVNDTTYHLQVVVTDTASNSGSSSVISFTLQYTPPSDMQGQALATAHNYLLGPHFLYDTNLDGIADNWTSDSNGPVSSYTYSRSLATDVPQPWQRPNGDGPYTAAQKVNLVSCNGAGSGQIRVDQTVDITIPGWTAGSTHLSLATWLMVQVNAGAFTGYSQLDFYDGTNTFLSSAFGSGQGDTAGQVVQQLGPQNALIPATTRYVHVILALATSSTADVGTVWFMGAQLEAAAASDANFISGDLGTGYSYDLNNFSVRSNLAGNMPTIAANPGADSDPLAAPGGTITIGWDATLADSTRFNEYLIERRRLDQQTDDTAWEVLATITNKAVNSYTDWQVGGTITYQYSIRQQITYPADGSIGVSANRAIVVGSCDYSPAWYLTNASATIYNMRLRTTDPKRSLVWKENAQYNQFLGRVGVARDAGPDAGFQFDITAYFNTVFGDDTNAVRRLLVQMQRLNLIWFLRGSEGLCLPVHLDGFKIDEEDTFSDRLITVDFSFTQAEDTPDY